MDNSRKGGGHEKKVKSVASYHMVLADIVGCGTNAITLFNLPPNAIITDAYVVVADAAQGGVTVDFGFSGGTELGSALAVSATGVKESKEAIAALTLTEGTPNTLSAGTVTKGLRVLTSTGKVVTAKFSAEPNESIEMDFVVEFVEYRRRNGEVMPLTAA